MIKQIETTIEDLYNFYKLYPEYKGKIEVETRFGFYDIEECAITSFNSDVIEIITESGISIKCSPDHELFSDDEWKKAKQLRQCNFLFSKNGVEKIKHINLLDYKEDLYDLQVKTVHEFYANNIVSHNSTILDAMSFCLFGTPYRKIKIEELINRRNKKRLSTECHFTIDGKDQYVVTRHLNPNKLDISKNGKSLDLLSSKKLNQEEIDKILGINQQLFKQVISLAVNYNKPFLSLSAMEKRDIVEQIFNIKIFGSMLKIHKTNQTDTKIKYESYDKIFDILKENIKSLRSRIKELKEALDNFDKNKTDDVLRIQTRIDKESADLLSLKTKLEDNIRLFKLITIQSIDDMIVARDDINRKINEKQYSNSESEKQLSVIIDNTVCPLCNSDITESHKNEEISRLKELIENNNKDLINIKNEKKIIDDKIKQCQEDSNKISKLKSDSQNINEKIKMINSNLSNLIKDKINIQSRQIEFNMDSVVNEFENKIKEYKKMHGEINSLRNKIKNNDVVSSILSETGIKSFIFKKLTPILNTKINKYIHTFELPVQIKFNEFMEENIKNLDSSQDGVSYYSYSEGEKKRIDIAIWLAFIDITKLICNWKSNLLIFDELLDGQVDDSGLDKIISCIKQIIKPENICSYVISHRLSESVGFDDRYEILKSNSGFSVIRKISNT